MASTHYPEERISPYTLGIDFGTGNSTLAVYKRGAVEFLPVEGSIIVPSVVTFRDGMPPLIGMAAKRSALVFPDKTVTSVKMALGDPAWKLTHDGKDYTPTDIAALILGYLREGVQSQSDIDLEGTVQRAVLCVPANFETNKREELLRAASEMVGLEVRLLEEPVAAAIAHATQRQVDTTILVYDLGAGTMDACVLRVNASADPDVARRFEVLGKGGISHLGGDDFDRKLMEQFAERIKQAAGLDVLDLAQDQGVSVKKLRAAQQTLKELAERAKIELSEAASVTVHEPGIIRDEAGREYGLTDEKITREEFLHATHDLLLATRQPVEEALKEAGVGVEEIDRIILAGGSTRMAGVKEMVREMFGKEPWSDIDPTTLVARGAALYGAGGILEQNRTSHFLGIELLNQRFGKLIEKNAPLPAQTARVYQTVEVDPEAIRITVVQSYGEIDYTTDKAATCLGEFFLVIPEDKRQKAFRNVRVGMEMTTENLLKIRAELEDEAGVCEAVEIRREGESDGRRDTNPA